MNNKIINLSDEREEILRNNITWVKYGYDEITQIMTAMQEYAEWYHEAKTDTEAQRIDGKPTFTGKIIFPNTSVPSEQDDASIGFI